MAGMKVAYKSSGKNLISKGKQILIRQKLMEYAVRVQAMYQEATSTWIDRPSFPIHEIRENGALILNIGPDPAEEDSYHIFRYVDKGTSIRYAVMSKGFQPKSRPHSLSASSGAGGLSYFDFENPRPGIEAREFGVEIVKALREDFKRDIESILRA